MSCDIDSDSFHVKKGGRRKTVSPRRAYVNTPRQIDKALSELYSLVALGKVEKALNQINKMRFKFGK